MHFLSSSSTPDGTNRFNIEGQREGCMIAKMEVRIVAQVDEYYESRSQTSAAITPTYENTTLQGKPGALIIAAWNSYRVSLVA